MPTDQVRESSTSAKISKSFSFVSRIYVLPLTGLLPMKMQSVLRLILIFFEPIENYRHNNGQNDEKVLLEKNTITEVTKWRLSIPTSDCALYINASVYPLLEKMFYPVFSL